LIAIDTNVLVRIIVEDKQQPQQTQKARALVLNADKVYIPQLVQAESIWVLSRVYKLNKIQLIHVLESLASTQNLILQHKEIFNLAIELFKESKADFADCLILAESLQVDAVLHTFDKRLSLHDEVKLVTESE